MERIGLAASKIAKGNFFLYNLYVVLIASLFSLFVFVITGATIVFALAIISYIGSEIIGFDFKNNLLSLLSFSMTVLSVLAMLFNFVAIFKNIKFRPKES